MKTFNSFNIKVSPAQTFVGNKVKVSKILNRKISVHAFKIEMSKLFKGECLHLQVEVNSAMHVIFTGSEPLIEAIKQVPKSGLPFTTTIVEENDRYLFT